MTDKLPPEKCKYCGNDIRPLDRHAHSVSPDKDAHTNGQIMITCILNRYYSITTVDKVK